MKTIPLTKGYFVKVDDEDYEKLAIHRWYAVLVRGVYVRPSRTVYKDGKKKNLTMARVIINAPEDKYVDHINNDSLDNRKKNLRLCTREENRRNTGLRKDNKSGYIGVRYNKRLKKWIAAIGFKGKVKHLGCYETKELAAISYNKMAKIKFGEFARLNIVEFKPTA